MVFGVKRVRGGWLEEQCEQAEYANGEYFADLCNNLSIDVGLGICRFKASLINLLGSLKATPPMGF